MEWGSIEPSTTQPETSMNFLETPAVFTRTRRTAEAPADYANPFIGHATRDTDYSPLWWGAITAISIVGAVVIVFGG